MERKEIDHITNLLNVSANVAAQKYPSLRAAIGDIVGAYNRGISHTQRAAVLVILESFREAILSIDKNEGSPTKETMVRK